MAKRTEKTAAPSYKAGAVSKEYASAVAEASKAPVGAQVWRPEEPGEAVAGQIISFSWRDGTDRPYCSVLLDTGKDAVMVRLGTILVREFHERKILSGSKLAIVYRGEAPSGHRGRPAKLFSLKVVKMGTGEQIVSDLQATYTANPKPRSKSKKGTRK